MAHSDPIFAAAPFYHYLVRPLARTPGVYNEVLQPKFELPLFDMSGPTHINRNSLSYTQGAINEGPQFQTVYGVQGVPNKDALDLAGLLDQYNPHQNNSGGE